MKPEMLRVTRDNNTQRCVLQSACGLFSFCATRYLRVHGCVVLLQQASAVTPSVPSQPLLS